MCILDKCGKIVLICIVKGILFYEKDEDISSVFHIDFHLIGYLCCIRSLSGICIKYSTKQYSMDGHHYSSVDHCNLITSVEFFE